MCVLQHFKFRQMRRISTGLRIPNGVTGKYSLLCCANTYGMLLIGGNNSFVVCHTAMLYKVNDEDTNDRNQPGMVKRLVCMSIHYVHTHAYVTCQLLFTLVQTFSQIFLMTTLCKY